MATLRRLNELPSGSASREERPETRSRLQSVEDWSGMLESSETEPILIFKHSTTCGISSHVLAAVNEFLSKNREVPFGIVHVVEDRRLSDAIADHTGIRHESPQMIAIRNKRPIWHTSHWSIDFAEVERLLPTAV